MGVVRCSTQNFSFGNCEIKKNNNNNKKKCKVGNFLFQVFHTCFNFRLICKVFPSLRVFIFLRVRLALTFYIFLCGGVRERERKEGG